MHRISIGSRVPGLCSSCSAICSPERTAPGARHGKTFRPIRASTPYACPAGRTAHSPSTRAGHTMLTRPIWTCSADKRRRILAAGPTDILYLGKAGARTSDLRKRVRQLARFGVGRTSKHRGGEWLWQLKGIEDAELRMWCCARGSSEPLERELLARFKHDHGEWPLANRSGS